MAAASPNNQSFILGDEDEDDDNEEPSEPQDPWDTEEPPYPGSETTGDSDNPDGSDTLPTNTTRSTEVGPTLPTGMVVPLYSKPYAGEWLPLIEQKGLHQNMTIIASVNPNNGPGAATDPVYEAGINSLLAAGIWPIGYVSTKFKVEGMEELQLRPAAEVKTAIDTWAKLYPAVPGIFFDEQDNKVQNVKHYQELGDYARTQGYTLTVGNPGTMWIDLGYFSAFDIILIYETTPMPTAAEMMEKLAGNGIPRERCAIAPYAVSPLDTQAVQNATTWVQYIYVTDRTLGSNPWAALPSAPYLNSLFEALDPTPATP